MKRQYILFAILLLIPFYLGSLELSTSFGWDNSSFDQSRTTSFSDSAASFIPKGALYWTIDMKETLTEKSWVAFTIERSPILHDRVKAVFGLDYNVLSVSAGPILSPFVTDERVLGAGLSSDLSLHFPGVAFIQLANETSLGSGLTMTGDYFQALSTLHGGFWVPNVLVSFRISLEEYIEKSTATHTSSDKKMRYELINSFFKKNIPYTIEVRLGYQNATRALSSAGSETQDTLHTLIIGLAADARVHPKADIFFDAEIYLAPWTSGGMRAPDSGTLLYSAQGGLRLRLPNLFINAQTESTWLD